ncbi:MAG: hypothetical protein AB201_02155 [Parcubacteria bacterium C7867-006]|nr:MAG: hypothetical protein AB201_02155 [Parcubacteria bacterium C7867-006]
MNTIWLDKVSENIFPLSLEQKDIKKALTEWIYEGNFYDLETPSELCQLCNHPDIRYQFEIRNKNTSSTLLIGSECVTRFGGIVVVDGQGNTVEIKEAKKRVAKDKNKLIRDAETKSVINTLVTLGSYDHEFDISNFLKYYQERMAFTPNQLSTILWRIEKHKVYFNKSHFKLTIKREREKQQLLNMEDWKLKKLFPCLSSSQKKFIQDATNNK